jgi:glycosyltransferase involved in cell wall biosynthesis
MDRVVFVSWTRDNARSHGLAQSLGARAHFMPWANPGASPPDKIISWLRSAARTWKVVRQQRGPSLVVVMSPPVFAPLVALLARRSRSVRVAIDAHSGAFNDERWRWSFGLMAALCRRADALIVTNRELIEPFDVGDCPVIELHDPLNESPPVESQSSRKGPYVVFPSSGAPDEPFDAVAGAIPLLTDDVEVVVTGSRVPASVADAGASLPGFLPRDEYLALVSGCDAVLALTTREATMQRTAYEAAEAGKGLVASGTRVLRETFGPMAVFTEHEPRSLAAAVREAVARREELERGAAEVADRLRRQEAEGVARLLEMAGG